MCSSASERPSDIDSWLAAPREDDVSELTQALDSQLRDVTLNFATAERADRAVRLAHILSALAAEPGPVAEPRSLDAEVELARRIDRATDGAGDCTSSGHRRR